MPDWMMFVVLVGIWAGAFQCWIFARRARRAARAAFGWVIAMQAAHELRDATIGRGNGPFPQLDEEKKP